MGFMICDEKDATHVRVLEDEYNHTKLMGVTVGKVYEIFWNDDPSFEGEEMIENDLGEYCCSFSLVVKVEWLKEII